MDAIFVRIQRASGDYAVGQWVAVFLKDDDKEFKLTKQDTMVRHKNRSKYGQDTVEEKMAIAAFTRAGMFVSAPAQPEPEDDDA